MAPTGSVAMGEIDQVIQRLHARIDEPHAWWEEWSAMAEFVERAGDAAAAAGKRDATAGNYYLRAGNYYYTGERMIEPGAQKTAMYKKALLCFHEGLKRRYSNIEFVDVPYEGSALPANFMKSAVAKGPAPTVVMFDGLDNCKEMSVLFGGLELAHRGFHVLAIDGPGQGEALRLRNLASRYDYEVPAAAAYDYVASRGDVAKDRVALMAYSAGGYYAPRAVAFEKRYKAATVAWGGLLRLPPHVWQKRWRRVMQARITTASATSHFQLPWVLGVANMETAMEKLKKFTLDGVADKIKCPMLVCWGEEDKLTPREVAHQLYDNVGSKDKTLKVFTAAEGGADHVQVDNRQVGTDYICDWLSARLHP